MDGTPWRVKLTAKPMMAATTASNPAASPAGSDVDVYQRQGVWVGGGSIVRLGARGKGVAMKWRGGARLSAHQMEERGGRGPTRAAAVHHRWRRAAVGVTLT
jgi:hypothetical protein